MNCTTLIIEAWKEGKPAMYQELKQQGKLEEMARLQGDEMQKRIEKLITSGMFPQEAFEIVKEDYL